MYFGSVDTEMTRIGFNEDPLGARVKAVFPTLLMRPIGPDAAAAAVVRGIERRTARIIAPRRWVPLSLLRGFVIPLIDHHFERHAELHEIVRDADRLAPAMPEPAGNAR